MYKDVKVKASWTEHNWQLQLNATGVWCFSLSLYCSFSTLDTITPWTAQYAERNSAISLEMPSRTAFRFFSTCRRCRLRLFASRCRRRDALKKDGGGAERRNGAGTERRTLLNGFLWETQTTTKYSLVIVSIFTMNTVKKLQYFLAQNLQKNVNFLLMST